MTKNEKKVEKKEEQVASSEEVKEEAEAPSGKPLENDTTPSSQSSDDKGSDEQSPKKDKDKPKEKPSIETEKEEVEKEKEKDEYDPDEEHTLQEKGTGSKKITGHIMINKKDDPRAQWYVVHTASGHEVRVAETLRQRVETQGLEDKIFELLVPTQDRVIIRGGKKQNIKEKIFPGYLLIKLILDDPTWLAVRTTPGITGFVGTGKTPSPLSEAEVANIQKFVATPAKRFKTKFSKSEAVRITDGPFSGFLGSVDDIDEEKGKVKVLVSIFGRETPVELDLLQISKV